MAELAGLVIGASRFFQIWGSAVDSVGIITNEERASLIEDYTMCVGALEHCIGVIKGQDSVSNILETAIRRCLKLADNLAKRQEKLVKNKRRPTFLLAGWDTLQAEYKRFSDSVRLVQDLTHESVAPTR